MANPEDLAILKKGVKHWNRWRLPRNVNRIVGGKLAFEGTRPEKAGLHRLDF